MLEEYRTQPRVQVDANLRIYLEEIGCSLPAKLHNISWGGLEFRIAELPGKLQDIVVIHLPWRKDQEITIEAEVLRIRVLEDGVFAVATKFSSLSGTGHRKLQNLLETLLAQQHGVGREHPKIAERLELFFDHPAEMRVTLEEISRGSLLVDVPKQFNHNQSLALVVSGLAEFPSVSLRARVTHQALLDAGGAVLYEVGLAFEHPAMELKAKIRKTLDRLSKIERYAVWNNPRD